MIKDVTKWIDACHRCQRRKQHKPNRQGEQRSVLYTKPFEIVSIDLVGPLLENVDNNKWILTIIDHFTRYPIAVAIPNKKEETVAKALKTHLFMAYPFWPKKIDSDRRSEFVNKALKLLYKQLGVKRILTAHDNAQANQVERFHKYMNAAIACFLQKKHRQILWEQYLDIAVYVYRCTVNNSTGYSPFFAAALIPRASSALNPIFSRKSSSNCSESIVTESAPPKRTTSIGLPLLSVFPAIKLSEHSIDIPVAELS